MATHATRKAIVQNGCDLTLLSGGTREQIHELAQIAATTGARLTVRATLPTDFVVTLAATFGKTVAFIDGLGDFEKAKS